MSNQNRTELISLFDEYVTLILTENNIEIPEDYDDDYTNENFNDKICRLYFHSATLYDWIDEQPNFEGRYSVVREFFKEYIYEIDKEYLLNLIDPVMLK